MIFFATVASPGSLEGKRGQNTKIEYRYPTGGGKQATGMAEGPAYTARAIRSPLSP